MLKECATYRNLCALQNKTNCILTSSISIVLSMSKQ
jgi:hypothetical protein